MKEAKYGHQDGAETIGKKMFNMANQFRKILNADTSEIMHGNTFETVCFSQDRTIGG
jgi:hypothetical protein